MAFMFIFITFRCFWIDLNRMFSMLRNDTLQCRFSPQTYFLWKKINWSAIWSIWLCEKKIVNCHFDWWKMNIHIIFHGSREIIKFRQVFGGKTANEKRFSSDTQNLYKSIKNGEIEWKYRKDPHGKSYSFITLCNR